MGFLIQIDALSMDLSILYFKGSKDLNIFLSLKIVFSSPEPKAQGELL